MAGTSIANFPGRSPEVAARSFLHAARELAEPKPVLAIIIEWRNYYFRQAQLAFLFRTYLSQISFHVAVADLCPCFSISAKLLQRQ